MQQATENNNKDSGEWKAPIVVIKTIRQYSHSVQKKLTKNRFIQEINTSNSTSTAAFLL